MWDPIQIHYLEDKMENFEGFCIDFTIVSDIDA